MEVDGNLGLSLQSLFWYFLSLFCCFLLLAFSEAVSLGFSDEDKVRRRPTSFGSHLLWNTCDSSFCYYCCCFQEVCKDSDVSSQAKSKTEKGIFGKKPKKMLKQKLKCLSYTIFHVLFLINCRWSIVTSEIKPGRVD